MADLPGAVPHNFSRWASESFRPEILQEQGLVIFALPIPMIRVEAAVGAYRNWAITGTPLTDLALVANSPVSNIDRNGPYYALNHSLDKLGWSVTQSRAISSLLSGSVSGITILGWVQLDGDPGGGVGRILQKSNGSTGDDWYLSVEDGFQSPTFRVTTASGTTTIGAGGGDPLTTTKMHFVGGFWRRFDGLMEVYGDDLLIESATHTGGAGETLTNTAAGIGIVTHIDAINRYLNGRVYYARAYARTIDFEEIQFHQKSPGWAFEQA